MFRRLAGPLAPSGGPPRPACRDQVEGGSHQVQWGDGPLPVVPPVLPLPCQQLLLWSDSQPDSGHQAGRDDGRSKYIWYFKQNFTLICVLSSPYPPLSRSSSTEYPGVPDLPEDRAEPASPEDCCDDLQQGQFCRPSCVKRIQNDETALAVDVGYYLDFQASSSWSRDTPERIFLIKGWPWHWQTLWMWVFLRGAPRSKLGQQQSGGLSQADLRSWGGTSVSDHWGVRRQSGALVAGLRIHVTVLCNLVISQDFLTALDKMSLNGNDPSQLNEGLKINIDKRRNLMFFYVRSYWMVWSSV